MPTEQDEYTIYRENRVYLSESRPGVLKCEWGPRNEGPEAKHASAGTVKISDFESEEAARQFLLRRAKKMIDADQAKDEE